MGEQYPFGARVQSTARRPDGHRAVFVLGAYPSALHVRWTPPAASGLAPVRALAVDDEPWPFWDGADEVARVAAWRERHFDADDGEVAPVGHLNGSSGRWVRDRVLTPLAVETTDAWLTDCLDTYRASDGQSGRISDTYQLYASTHGLPEADLGAHPNEDQIVREALDLQRDRLLHELDVARPEMIVTLGRAAARVLHALLDLEGKAELSLDPYGVLSHVAHDGRPVVWVALAHPGAPSSWQQAHERWMAERTAGSRVSLSGDDRAPAWLPQRLLAAGQDAPQVLAEYVSERLASRARERAEQRRRSDPDKSTDALVRRTISGYVRLARAEGAVAGLTLTAAEVTTVFGTAGTLTLPAAVTGIGADLTSLAWIQCRMVLEIAVLRGDPLDDTEEVAKELLILWGLHSPTRQVGRIVGHAGQRVGRRLLERYLRGAALQSIKAMFRVVGIRFARAGLVRGLPVINIPANAAVNDVSTRALARRANAYYRQKNG